MFIRNVCLTGLAAVALTAAGPGHALNYDCAKAGNANKAACKGKVPPAKSVAPVKVAAPAPHMAPAHMAPVKHAPAAGGRMVSATQKNGKTVQYNCDKKGNTAKTACKR